MPHFLGFYWCILISVDKNKILTFNKAISTIKKHKKEGKTVGLITGCFDVVHVGHLEIFYRASQRVDALVVGIDTDKAIKLSKGKRRPINKESHRLLFLSSLSNIDYVFTLPLTVSFDSSDATKNYEAITKKLHPTHLITSFDSDKYWKEKKKRAEKLNIRFVGLSHNKKNSY